MSQARSPSPSRAASAVLARVEAERDSALADVRRVNMQLDNLEDKLKVCGGKYLKILEENVGRASTRNWIVLLDMRVGPVYEVKRKSLD